ncbi:MAG: PEP-CTERM sorting domain-containing protein [Acidobacteria bacterium]|nr:PEP-CTERM sorting domain-containing protein [Acidobacteriota bacterium]
MSFAIRPLLAFLALIPAAAASTIEISGWADHGWELHVSGSGFALFADVPGGGANLTQPCRPGSPCDITGISSPASPARGGGAFGDLIADRLDGGFRFPASHVLPERPLFEPFAFRKPVAVSGDFVASRSGPLGSGEHQELFRVSMRGEGIGHYFGRCVGPDQVLFHTPSYTFTGVARVSAGDDMSPVPEPSSWALFTAALVLLPFLRRLRRA